MTSCFCLATIHLPLYTRHIVFWLQKLIDSPLDCVLTALSLSFWTHSRKEEKTAATEPSSASSLADTAATSSRSGSAVCRGTSVSGVKVVFSVWRQH